MRIRCPECFAEAKTILRQKVLAVEGTVYVIDSKMWLLCSLCGLEKDSETLKKEIVVP